MDAIIGLAELRTLVAAATDFKNPTLHGVPLRFPVTTDKGPMWACCVSTIGPVCGHRAAPCCGRDLDDCDCDSIEIAGDEITPEDEFAMADLNGDYIVNYGRGTVMRYGRVLFRIGDEEPRWQTMERISNHMAREAFWPNVWDEDGARLDRATGDPA